MADKRSPLWLPTNLDETCGWCLQVYVYEHRYHCDWCDAPVCPTCIVERRELRVTLCPDCAEEASADADASGDGGGGEGEH